jgi:hypothetical protein
VSRLGFDRPFPMIWLAVTLGAGSLGQITGPDHRARSLGTSDK